MDHVLAVDLGGTKITAGLVDQDGAVDRVVTVSTPGGDGPDAVIAAVVEAAAIVCGAEAAPPRAVGVGTAGGVDATTGRIVTSTETLAGWAGTRLADRLRDSLAPVLGRSTPVWVLNDVDAHALGESRYGAAAGCASALVVAIGTGIGASIVLDGAVMPGAHHVAGEMGHLPIAGAETLRCPCGRRGHLEALGSGPGLYRRYVQLGGAPADDNARVVTERAVAGEPAAVQAVSESAAAVGRGIAAVVTVVDPACVVVTGGMARAGLLWWESMLGALRAELIDVLRDVPVRAGELRERAPLVGAAVAAREMSVRRP